LGGLAIPPNIIQIHVSVLVIVHLQVVHNLLNSIKIWAGLYSRGKTRSRLTILGSMAMPPNIIQLHVSFLGVGVLQVLHNLLVNYTICLDVYYRGKTRSSLTIFGGMAMPPNFI